MGFNVLQVAKVAGTGNSQQWNNILEWVA